jgi:hypothetical protein
VDFVDPKILPLRALIMSIESRDILDSSYFILSVRSWKQQRPNSKPEGGSMMMLLPFHSPLWCYCRCGSPPRPSPCMRVEKGCVKTHDAVSWMMTEEVIPGFRPSRSCSSCQCSTPRSFDLQQAAGRPDLINKIQWHLRDPIASNSIRFMILLHELGVSLTQEFFRSARTHNDESANS